MHETDDKQRAGEARSDTTLLRRCPQCDSAETYRSHRKVWERLLFSIKPYRCKMCRHRFYSRISSHDLHV